VDSTPLPLYPRQRTPVLIEREGGRTPNPRWTRWRTEKPLASTGSLSSDRAACRIAAIVATPTVTPQLLLCVVHAHIDLINKFSSYYHKH
jgi:hypothetical protein